MSRKARTIKKKVKIFVEGHSEENYIKGLKKAKKVSVIETPVNLKGGGYTTFISALRKHIFDGYLATFLVLDMDRYVNDPNEAKKFKELIKRCNEENKTKNFCFVVGNNKNIETFFAMHFLDFNEKKDFLKSKIINYDKNDADIFNKLNTNNASYNVSIENQKVIDKSSIKNQYNLERKGLYNIIKNTVVFCEDNLTFKHSNMNDLFDVLQI